MSYFLMKKFNYFTNFIKFLTLVLKNYEILWFVTVCYKFIKIFFTHYCAINSQRTNFIKTSMQNLANFQLFVTTNSMKIILLTLTKLKFFMKLVKSNYNLGISTKIIILYSKILYVKQNSGCTHDSRLLQTVVVTRSTDVLVTK